MKLTVPIWLAHSQVSQVQHTQVLLKPVERTQKECQGLSIIPEYRVLVPIDNFFKRRLSCSPSPIHPWYV